MRDAIILIFANKQDLPDGESCFMHYTSVEIKVRIQKNQLFKTIYSIF